MMRNYLTPKSLLISLLSLAVIGVLVWQGVTASGAPDPTSSNLNSTAAILDTAVLVFREGLEAILVLSAITAGLVRKKNDLWKPISVGAGFSLLATLVTWFVVVGIISLVGNTTSELNIQAGTGLLANIVLLVIMNWFFHKIYWTGWISLHSKKQRKLTTTSTEEQSNTTYFGLVILGLTSMYREGFEVVLFIQNIRLQVGSHIVLAGAAIGLGFTLAVAVLTFYAHRHLPYKKMLVLTGILLGVVLLVMVGETVQEMQLAGWISTTPVAWKIPDWMGLWLSVIPTKETLWSQVFAVVFTIGSYYAAQYLKVGKAGKAEPMVKES